MYLAFYGLAEKPFRMTPDPRFLYLTPGHREALAQLTHAIREGEGFVALTGDVGTGKTTLLRALLAQLDEKTAVAVVVNSTLPFDGILEYVLEDFGVPKAGETRDQCLVALNYFLIERHRAGQQSVIIIDEAQHLDAATLEQLRLLSNFQTPRETLLQILLAGQPELRARLDLPELRQLKQRIVRCAIRPLTPDEVRAYVRFRLRVAGGRDLDLFTDQAIARIAQYATGIPRVVNTLADHCLLIGYADQRRRVTRDTVDEAIAYLEDGAPAPRRRAGSRGRARRRVLGWAVARAGGAMAAAGRGVGHGVSAGGQGIASVGSMLGAAVRGIGIALGETARSVGRGVWMSARGIAATGALLWAGAVAVGASVAAAGRGVGHGVRSGARVAMLAGAAAKSARTGLVTTGRSVGDAVRTGGRGVVSAGAMLRAWAWRVATSVARARSAASQHTEAWVTHQAASISPKLRGWSPGAVVAILGLVAVTLVLALWPMSYEPPRLERPPPSETRESRERPPDAELKPSDRTVSRGGVGARPREPSQPPRPAAREPVTFTTVRPPSDR